MGRKVLDKTLSAAAALLGRKGGSRNTEAQKKAHVAAAKHMNEVCDPAERSRKAAAAISPENRTALANARWAKRYAAMGNNMSNDEFRELCKDFTAKEIAEALNISAAKVATWRRKVNSILIGDADAARIREWVKGQGK